METQVSQNQLVIQNQQTDIDPYEEYDINSQVESKTADMKKTIREMDYDTLKNNVYVCFANGCILLTSFLNSKGEPGWTQQLINENGEYVLTSKEQKQIESAFASAPWLSDLMQSISKSTMEHMKGGDLSLNPAGTALVTQTKKSEYTGNDISLDLMLENFLKKVDEMDQFWSTFAQVDPGIAKKIQDFDIPIPIGAVPLQVPAKPIVQFLIILIDSLRFSAALAGQQSYLLTLFVLIEEVLTGQWRQMLFTAAGFLSPSGTAIGVLFKYIINAWTMIAPDIRNDIITDMFRGTKSLLLGFLLWSATSLPPKLIRDQLEASLTQMRSFIDSMDEKVKALEGKANETLIPQGFQLQFSGLQEGIANFRSLSMVDIQNLQALARWNLVVCTKEFDDIIRGLSTNPIFRFILELIGVPVTETAQRKICQVDASEYPSVSEKLTSLSTPSITPIEPAKGGSFLKRKTRNQQKRKQTTRKKPKRI